MNKERRVIDSYVKDRLARIPEEDHPPDLDFYPIFVDSIKSSKVSLEKSTIPLKPISVKEDIRVLAMNLKSSSHVCTITSTLGKQREITSTQAGLVKAILLQQINTDRIIAEGIAEALIHLDIHITESKSQLLEPTIELELTPIERAKKAVRDAVTQDVIDLLKEGGLL